MIDLRLALPDDGQLVGDAPIFTRCPKHKDANRGNLAVYPHHLHCYGCGFHLGNGRCEDQECLACQKAHHEALELLLGHEVTEPELLRYTVERLDAYRARAGEEARRDPLPIALAQAYHELLRTTRRDRATWLYARGLTDATLATYLLGHNGFQFTIPIFDRSGALLTFRLRRDEEYGDKRPKYMGMAGRNGLYLYPENYLYSFEPESVVLCEGELDAVRLWQEGIPAVTVTNGAGQVPKIPGLLPDFVRHIVIATDQDDAGNLAATLTERAWGRSCARLNWSTGKDITEALQLGLPTRSILALLGDGAGVGRAA